MQNKINVQVNTLKKFAFCHIDMLASPMSFQTDEALYSPFTPIVLTITLLYIQYPDLVYKLNRSMLSSLPCSTKNISDKTHHPKMSVSPYNFHSQACKAAIA